MKVRIGVGAGAGFGDLGTAEGGFAGFVDRLEAAGVDSLWLPDTVSSPLPDPAAGLAFAAGRTSRLKLGTGVTVLPGRNPAAVAKQLATLASLAPGRVLPAFGLRTARRTERDLFPVAGPRGEVFDEALTLVRLLLTGAPVDFGGTYFTCRGAQVLPVPARPLDLWAGGSGPAALRRVGRLADGWLGAAVTPAEAGAARKAIEAAAAEAGRAIDADHYGMSIAVAFGERPEALVRGLRERRGDAADPDDLVPLGWAAARRLVRRHIDEGVSKFVIRPAGAPPSVGEFLDGLASELLPLEMR